jgi:hypothetical protein
MIRTVFVNEKIIVLRLSLDVILSLNILVTIILKQSLNFITNRVMNYWFYFLTTPQTQ